MRNGSLPSLLAGVATLLLLSSCSGWVQWNIGGCIRAGSATYAGVDVHGPAIHYEKRGEQDAAAYCLASEVLYRTEPVLVQWRDPSFPANEDAYDVRPTGRKLLFRKSDHVPVDAVPPGYVAESLSGCACGRTTFSSSELGRFDSPQSTRGSFAAQIAAAPFDFIVDPTLTAVCTAGAYTGMTCAGIILFPFVLLNPDAFP